MIPYFLLLGIPFLMSVFIRDSYDKRKHKIIIDIFFIIWLILLFLRDESIGVDLKIYLNTFQIVKGESLHSALVSATTKGEFGFVVLTKFIADVFGSFRAEIIIVAIISLVPIWLYYRKEVSSNSYLAISILMTLGIFSFSFSGLRQIIAVGCSIPCMYFVKNKKPIYFLLIVAVAFLFHRSAIILLLMYPVYRMNLKWNRKIWIIIPALVIAFVFRIQLFNFFYKFIDDFYLYNVSSTNAYAMLVLFVLFLIISYILPDSTQIDFEIQGLRNLMILSVFLQIFSSINPLAMRMNYYYIIFIPVLISKIISIPQMAYTQAAKLAKIVMCVFFTAYYFYNAYTGSDYVNIYPYLFL